jgi:signal transduction histidine kinase
MEAPTADSYPDILVSTSGNPDRGKIAMPRVWPALQSRGYEPFDLQIERLIVAARGALVGFALVAVYLEPAEFAPNVREVSITLALYLTFALFSGLLAAGRGRIPSHWQVPLHLVEICFISLLLFLSKGLASPFFVICAFVLLAATLRWNWRGAVYSTLLLAFLLFIQMVGDPEFELNQVVMRSIFLLVTGAMLAFFGLARERSHDRLVRLSEWPNPAADLDSQQQLPLATVLPHIAAVMEAPRLLVVWAEPEEVYTNFVTWTDGRYHEERRSSDEFEVFLGPELEDKSFASNDVTGGTYIGAAGANTPKLPLIGAGLRQNFNIRSVASAAFAGSICRGRVFIVDRPDWNQELLLLTEIIASRIGIELEHYILRRQLTETAAARERIRLARDLHDGILQSLTAAGLQLRAASSRSSGQQHDMLEQVRQLLIDEQRRIRAFVEERQFPILERHFDFGAQLRELIAKLQRLWHCDIHLAADQENFGIARELAIQIEFIIAESVANAVRHGHASRVDMSINISDGSLMLQISDNGEGLPGFTGSYEANDLAAKKIGPLSLRNRIAELQGSLALSSSPTGVTLRILIPVLQP